VRGHNLLPSTILNRFHILLATLRQIHLALTISIFSNELRQLKPKVFIVDQLSACVPLLRWIFPDQQRILFYCHFPDQLLARRDERGALGQLKRLYRYPFDWFEGWSMSGSDRIVVNSNFTKSVVGSVFPGLEENELGVVYPCVDLNPSTTSHSDEKPLWLTKKILLSINRFERKKDIALAIHAYASLPKSLRKTTRLVLAGGYDPRNTENISYHLELVALADKYNLSNATAKTVPTALALPDNIEILFLLSVPGALKETLLHNARLLIYTPKNEHFGIVPVEAMQHGVPVLASNTGGPLETVIEGQTGWLRDADKPERWTGVMEKVLGGMEEAQLQKMKAAGMRRVREHFGRDVMAGNLEAIVLQMQEEGRAPFVEWRDILLVLGVAGAVLFALLGVVSKAVAKRQFGVRAGVGQ
jgi:alpha-1,3/alpha-1,6-mannosyltransferase